MNELVAYVFFISLQGFGGDLLSVEQQIILGWGSCSIIGVYVLYHLSVNIGSTIGGLCKKCKGKCTRKKPEPVAFELEIEVEEPPAKNELEVIVEVSEEESVRSQIDQTLQNKKLLK